MPTATCPHVPGLWNGQQLLRKRALVCGREHSPLFTPWAPFWLFPSRRRTLSGGINCSWKPDRSELVINGLLPTGALPSDVRDGRALIKGLLCLQEDGEINVKTAVLRLLFHRVEANSNTFQLEDGGPRPPRLLTWPQQARPGAQGVSLALSAPHLFPAGSLLQEREKRSEENSV